MPDPDDLATLSERSAYAKPDAPDAAGPSVDASDSSPTSQGSDASSSPGSSESLDSPTSVEGTTTPSPTAPDTPSPAPSDPAPASPGSTQPTQPGFLERLPWWTVPLILIGVPLLFAGVTQVVPDFYDEVVWQYYWGPIKADAMGCVQVSHLDTDRCASASAAGILAKSGYNVVNTLSWAVLLGVCILGIAQMLAVFRAAMDDQLILAATAWVVVGSVAHVLEDVGLFTGTLQYFFITPPIYLLFGAFGIASFLVAQWMRSIAARSDLHAALRMLWMLHMLAALVWLGLWLNGWPQIVVYVNPVWVALFATANYLVARWMVLRQGRVDPARMTLVLSLGTYLLVGAYVLLYLMDPWPDAAGRLPDPDAGMPTAFLIAPALAAALTVLVYLAARKAPKAILGTLLVGGSLLAGIAAVAVVNLLGQRTGLFAGLHGTLGLVVALAVAAAVGARWWMKSMRPEMPILAPLVAVAYAVGINLLLVFSQLVDAFSTALGVDLLGYTEKHVLSGRVLEGFRDFSNDIGWTFGAMHPTFFAFVPVKFIISLLVVYAIDVHSRDDARQHPTLIGLVKFAIIMVGIGPGVRNFTRMSLGV